MPDSKSYLHKIVNVVIDRPIGFRHPDYPDTIYSLNYGYIPNTKSGDGEPIDVYVLGLDQAVEKFTGQCIAIIHRLDDNDDKLIVVSENTNFTVEQIEQLTNFQEKYFKSEIIK